MDSRVEAMFILKQARDLLAERLSERIVACKSEILDEAGGMLFGGEIDAIFEQIGGKLMHVSQMISALPSEEPVSDMADAPSGDAFSSGSQLILSDFPSQEVNSPTSSVLALPGLPAPEATRVEAPVHSFETAPASFQDFASRVRTGDLSAAGSILAELFGVDAPRGQQCAIRFADQLSADQGFWETAMQLRVELSSTGHNGALMLLQKCFGLSAVEAIGVLQNLRARLVA
jgi:hypothetical protein